MNDNTPEGYLACADNERGMPILVLHAWWGLNDTIRTVCDRLAEAGFTAFAPDLYHGRVSTTIPEAQSLGQELEGRHDQAVAEVQEAVRFLLSRSSEAAGQIAVIGFSLGAFFATTLASSDPEIVKSVVLFYGAGPEVSKDCRASFLGHYAENDQYEERKYIDALERSINAASFEVTFYNYPGVGHWFFEPDRSDAYNESAADLAWQRTIAFLAR